MWPGPAPSFASGWCVLSRGGPQPQPRSQVKFSPVPVIAGAGPDGCHSKLRSSWALGPLTWDLGISLAADMVPQALYRCSPCLVSSGPVAVSQGLHCMGPLVLRPSS